MRKLLIEKGAVSPVLATVLLILVVVLGMSVAFAYFTDYVKNFQTGRGSSVMELVEIEDVWFKNASNVIEIWLYNYGKVEVKISSLYINGHLVNFNATNNPVEILPGRHGNITAYPTSEWTPNTAYRFRLATERGSAFEREYISPDVQ